MTEEELNDLEDRLERSTNDLEIEAAKAIRFLRLYIRMTDHIDETLEEALRKLHKMHRRAQLAEGKNIRSTRLLNMVVDDVKSHSIYHRIRAARDHARNGSGGAQIVYWSFFKSDAERAEARAKKAEAKLAKAVDVITCILATAYADDHTGWHNALDDARAALAELEAKPCGKRIDPIVVDLKTGWFEPK